MSLLTVCRALATNVGIPLPDVVATSAEREWVEAMRMANETGEELARRVDWGVLRQTTTFAGDGETRTFDLPSDFSRAAAVIALGSGVRTHLRSLTQGEWFKLVPAAGVTRYFKLDGNTIRLWPYPSVGTSISVSYLSTEWLTDATSYAADEDEALLNEDLLAKGLIVRWRRQKGMPFADEEAEFEAALVDQAQFDDKGRF